MNDISFEYNKLKTYQETVINLSEKVDSPPAISQQNSFIETKELRIKQQENNHLKNEIKILLEKLALKTREFNRLQEDFENVLYQINRLEKN